MPRREEFSPAHAAAGARDSSLYFQHGLKVYTTLAQRSELYTQYGGRQERWAHRHGRYGQDVCTAVEQRWLEVSTSRDNLDSQAPSLALGKSTLSYIHSTFMMTVSAFGSSMARVHAVAVLVLSTWARCCP